MGNQTITVRTGSDTVEKISNIAEAMDRSRNWVNEDALKQYIAQQAWYIEGIQEGRASLAEGKGIPHDEVMAGLAELIDGKIKDHEKTQ